MSITTSSAGYNNIEVADYLLDNGADVNAQDKGGLIPLHNASSYGVSTMNYLISAKIVHLHFYTIYCFSVLIYDI